MNIQDIAKLVNAKWVHQIRCGDTYRFVDISIVESEGRFFARQCKFGKKSWYHAFLEKHESHASDDLTFIAAPAQHFSGRGLFDGDKTLWASWIIQSERHNIFYSGDTGYDIHFQDIGERYGPFQLAFMENGQYDERFTAGHMLPEQGAVAYKELNAEKTFPIGWGMFALNLHTWYEPPQRLLSAVEDKTDVITPKIGVVYDLNDLPELARWWDEYPKQ